MSPKSNLRKVYVICGNGLKRQTDERYVTQVGHYLPLIGQHLGKEKLGKMFNYRVRRVLRFSSG